MMAILNGMRWNLQVVLGLIFLRDKDDFFKFYNYCLLVANDVGFSFIDVRFSL